MLNRRLVSAPHLVFAALAALLLTTPCLPAEDGAEPSSEGLQTELRSALQTLRTGRAEEKRETVEDARYWAAPFSTADRDDAQARADMESLRAILHTEKDDWILDRLLQNLPRLASDLLNPLYRDGLTHPSPNVRWRAIQWFHTQRDSEALMLLEDLWSSEARPWVVPDLLEALAYNSSEKHRADFLALARGGDAPLALAAIRAFEILHDEALIPDLAEIALDGNRPAHGAAIRALATWPESKAALDAVLRALQSTDRETLLSSIPALKNFPSEDALQRLMDLAGTRWDAQVRRTALRALAPMRPAGLVDLLVDILREPPSEGVSGLQSEAISILGNLHDPEVLPKLSGLDPSLGGADFGGLRELLENLAHGRADSPESIETIRVVCSFRDGDEPGEVLVAPPKGFQTLRCWEFPRVPGDPEDFTRIPGGTEVWIGDHFERGSESWVQVSGDETDDCWVPQDQLQPAQEKSSTGPGRPEDPYRIELDVLLVEFEGTAARALREAGLLKVIEPGDLVVGVALSLHPDEPQTIPVLLAGYQSDDSLLDDAVVELLNALSTALPHQPDLIEFFRKHPGAKEAIEDPSTDESGLEEEESQLIDP